MKQIISFMIIGVVFLMVSCQKEVEYVNSAMVRCLYPAEGSMLKVDFFKPDELQVFAWKAREHSTYKISFDVDMNFENAYVIDMGMKDSLKIRNIDLLKIFRTVWPDFGSMKRFFWRVEQNTNGELSSTWRYFSGILSVESFTDERDGEVYGAQQFVLNSGGLMTLMSENLRAKIYADGEELPVCRTLVTGDAVYDSKIGCFYSWASATRLTWDEAKDITLSKRSVQGVCPDGWHLPSMEEYEELRETLGRYNSGDDLKTTTYWKTVGTVTNRTKLNVLPSGFYWHEGVPAVDAGLGSGNPIAGFWTSTPALVGNDYAWEGTLMADDKKRASLLILYDDSRDINFQAYNVEPGVRNHCYPVRCIMDEIKE